VGEQTAQEGAVDVVSFNWTRVRRSDETWRWLLENQHWASTEAAVSVGLTGDSKPLALADRLKRRGSLPILLVNRTLTYLATQVGWSAHAMYRALLGSSETKATIPIQGSAPSLAEFRWHGEPFGPGRLRHRFPIQGHYRHSARLIAYWESPPARSSQRSPSALGRGRSGGHHRPAFDQNASRCIGFRSHCGPSPSESCS
jgi:hypothetical protein